MKNEEKTTGKRGTTEKEESLFGGGTLYCMPQKSSSQMMSYIYVTPHGKTLVFDGGTAAEAGSLERMLMRLGGKADGWFVTHAHPDHIDAVTKVLRGGRVETSMLYFNFPPTERLASYESGYVDSIIAFREIAEQTPHTVVKGGDRFLFDGCAVTAINSPPDELRDKTINNTTVVYRLDTAGKSILFLGDAGEEEGRLLLEAHGGDGLLRCEVVQAAHHGQSGVGREVYEAVAPEICLWPTPLWLWDNNGGGGKDSGPWLTLHTRRWLKELGVKTDVRTGRHVKILR